MHPSKACSKLHIYIYLQAINFHTHILKEQVDSQGKGPTKSQHFHYQWGRSFHLKGCPCRHDLSDAVPRNKTHSNTFFQPQKIHQNSFWWSPEQVDTTPLHALELDEQSGPPAKLLAYQPEKGAPQPVHFPLKNQSVVCFPYHIKEGETGSRHRRVTL